MADFTGTMLTVKGRNLLSKAQTGATLQFTKIKIGDGTWTTNTDPTQLNDLIDTKLTLPIQSIQVVGDGTVRLRFVLTNTGLQQGFFMREIGIFAQDPDLGEILYAVAYAGDRADFIPSDGTTKVENVVDIYTVIANSQNVVAVISDTVVIATKQDVDNLNTQLTTQINTVNTQLTTQINTVNTQLTTQINTVKPELGTTAPTSTYTGKLWLNTNTKFLQYYDGSNWQNVIVSNADKIDGFDASQTPAPNVIMPLNANARIYDYVSKGSVKFDPTDFKLANNTEYSIGSVNITTPSWSPSGAWKVIFVVMSNFYSDASGVNNFAHRIKYDTVQSDGGTWYWYAANSQNGMGVADTFLVVDLPNGVTKTFNFYVYQGGGNANAVFQLMRVDWYVTPA